MEPALRIEALSTTPVARRRLEIVERKGLGHPDTICDQVAEAGSRALCRAYLESAGRVLHHNIDKALLVAGCSETAFGGGRVTAPMRLILGDRATERWDGHTLPVGEIVTDAARRWIDTHLRYVETESHVRVESALRPGSAQLADVYDRERMGANDTSVGVGCAPATETEELVLAAEAFLNSPDFHARFPAAGEDVKVLGVRVERALELTVALAFVDRFVPDAATYVEQKAAMREALLAQLTPSLRDLDAVDARLNTLDAPERGAPGLYLTVLGTSADGADSGEVGRGNRVNGLITFDRPSSLEAAAGKNPVNHVGKIYNLLALRIARRLHAEVGGIEEARVHLVSRIGRPLVEPWLASAQLVLTDGVGLPAVEEPVRSLVAAELLALPAFLDGLLTTEPQVC